MCYKKNKVNYPVCLGRLTKHHRRPKSKGGKDLDHNISYIPEKLHNAYHYLFCNYNPDKVAEILTEHYIDPDYAMVAVPVEFLQTIFNILSKSKPHSS